MPKRTISRWRENHDGRAGFRPDIQGLRALAVTAVLLFHVFPGLVPGGYVGVDVFFVISGYLMTTLLLREAETTGRIALLGFYARRVRRLLPAAMVVLLAVTLATPFLLPEHRWKETGLDIIASALYVENWRLAWLAVDYLGAELPPSPVQHFWSLSIEEQFYIVWPLLILACLGVAVLAKSNFRRTLFLMTAFLTLFSFIASIIVTSNHQATAFFVTYTRIWELALGGLVVFFAPAVLRGTVGETVRAIGLAAIVGACLLFTSTTSFPGYVAALPALATALVLIAGRSSAGGTTYRLLSLRPVQHLGDTSYSLYLWHWPILIFFAAFVARTELTVAEGLIAIAATLVIAEVSKIMIEDRFRRAPQPVARSGRTVALGLGSAIASVMIVLLMFAGNQPLADMVTAKNTEEKFTPALRAVRNDRFGDCHVDQSETTPRGCVYGRTDSRFRVVLAGDSHAAQWTAPFVAIAERQGWRLTVHTKSACPLLNETVGRQGAPYDECTKWAKNVMAELKSDPPNLVILSQSSRQRLFGKDSSPERMARALSSTWRDIEALGSSVVAIRDTPFFPTEPTTCLSSQLNCSVRLDDIAKPDPMTRAGEILPTVNLIDMSEHLCPSGECPAAIDNLVVWRDHEHLTATFATALAPILEDKIEAILTASSRAADGGERAID